MTGASFGAGVGSAFVTEAGFVCVVFGRVVSSPSLGPSIWLAFFEDSSAAVEADTAEATTTFSVFFGADAGGDSFFTATTGSAIGFASSFSTFYCSYFLGFSSTLGAGLTSFLISRIGTSLSEPKAASKSSKNATSFFSSSFYSTAISGSTLT